MAAPPRPGTLQSDFFASLVVFLVALPLSLGIALASGAPAMAGVIAAAAGGIVVGLLGGAPLQVSGPAAGLTVMVFSYVQEFGFTTLCAITVLAGLLQLLLGVGKVARWALAIPPAVIHGMLAGIGILIALAQFQVVLGGKPQSNGLANLLHIPAGLREVNPTTLALGTLTFGILVLWTKLPATVRKVPGPLVAVSVSTLVSAALQLDVPRVTFDGSLLDSITPPTWDIPNAGHFVAAVVALAVVASAESLLCALATDQMHAGPKADLDRELMGQGVGNMVSGLLGGLPITGVIVRSSANITSGARTKVSSILHGVWVLVFVVFGAALVTRIPLAVLAGLLVHVGVNLVKPAHIRSLHKVGELPVYVLTVAGVVGVSLLGGIGLGLGLAAARLLWTVGRPSIDVRHEAEMKIVRIRGALTFLGVPTLEACLSGLPGDTPVQVLVESAQLDHAAQEVLENWIHRRERSGVHTQVSYAGRPR